MLAIIMLSAALLILVAAGVVLAVTRKNDAPMRIRKEETEFETKYDEVKYLYESGRISGEEYERQMKNIIN